MYDISYKRALKIASSVKGGPRTAKNLTYSETNLRAFLWNIRCYFKAFSECKGCFFWIHSLLQAKTCKEACVFGKEPLKEPEICSKISPSRKCQREQTYRGVLRRTLYVWHRDKEKEPKKVRAPESALNVLRSSTIQTLSQREQILQGLVRKLPHL